MILTIRWSLDGGFVRSATFSSANNLSFWLFNSISTLKKPMQYKIIPNVEKVVAKEGKRWFWVFFSMLSCQKGLIFIRQPVYIWPYNHFILRWRMKRHVTFQLLRTFVIVSLPKARIKSILACNDSAVINQCLSFAPGVFFYVYLFINLNCWITKSLE